MSSWLIVSLFTPVVLVLAYLIRVNYLLNGVPNDVKKLASPAWTKKDLERTYNDLKSHPIDYTSQIPPKLDRRYIVTGGNGKKLISLLLDKSNASTCSVPSKGLSEAISSFSC